MIRLAVVYCQFGAIHPFVDGNGRTDRVQGTRRSRKDG